MPATNIKHWIILLLTAIVAVAGIGLLPQLEQQLQQRRQSIAVFQPSKAKLLTDDRLVDVMSQLPLHSRLMKVGWDHAILTVDLLKEQPDEVWEDMTELILFSYSEVHNVRQVLIRIYQDQGVERTLLMAVETRKSDWDLKELAELRSSIFLLNPQFSSKIRLAFTPAGRRWLTNTSI
jgi:hypothetical protein